MTRRSSVIATLSIVVLLLAVEPALADPPGPTDYQSEVVSIDPPTPGITVEMVGGDAFVMLTSTAAAPVEVLGYGGEPYLRFAPDGTVERNAASPAAYLNQDRYGEAEVPAGVAADAPPAWETVATDGVFAWHDHRTHWMNDATPPGASPGDTILEGVVPLVVDGLDVDVHVVSTWERRPSTGPAVLGIGLGLVAAALVWNGVVGAAIVATMLTVLGLIAGIAAYAAVPSETDPTPLTWFLPLAALAFVVVGIRPGLLGLRALSRTRLSVLPLVGAAGLLAGWGLWRWDWLWRSVLPTSMPFWIDRTITGAAVAGGVGLVVSLVASAFRERPG